MHIPKDLVAASATPLVLGILTEGESYGYAILKRALSEQRRQWAVITGALGDLWHEMSPPTPALQGS